ncbi:MAG: hypothetical protein KY445_04705 [Armatimonadetes bacterium]|nr:hypothetical protein [Armatimonadota bacterium]
MLEFTLEVPTADLLRAAANVEPAKKAGLARVATAVQNIAERKVAAIRKRRVPTRREVALYNQRKRGARRKRRITASNAPAWKPTGELAKAVSAEPVFEGPDIVKLTADVPYAQPRHELGVSRIPKAPALGIVRKDPFFADAVKIVQPQAADLFADGFNSVWEAS